MTAERNFWTRCKFIFLSHEWYQEINSLGLCWFHASQVLSGNESTCQAGAAGSVSRLGRSPGERNVNPLQYSCPENLMDTRTWWTMSMGSQRVGHNWATNQYAGFIVIRHLASFLLSHSVPSVNIFILFIVFLPKIALDL